ncbi:MAG: competence protein ComEA helix-hairpin-helix repeat protein [Labilithrix sp.]|nr:competence protein ComEA helix-hairpin-helix repeat protein [Labilithrix sp.]
MTPHNSAWSDDAARSGRGELEGRSPSNENVPSSTPSLVARVRAAWNASAWTSLVGRGLLFLFGLVVLAWVGRTATAAAPNAAALRGSLPLELDAGAVEVALSPPPAPPPPMTAAPAQATPASPAPSSTNARATADDPVYVNVASAEELRRLPGVGPKRADAIVALRQRMGRFQRVEDLLRVKGVGRATLRKWRPLLRLDAPPAPSPAPAATPADAGAH